MTHSATFGFGLVALLYARLVVARDVSCGFERSNLCGWSSSPPDAWTVARVASLDTNATRAVDSDGNSSGRVVYLRGESGLLSSPALYAAPLCRLAFRYRLPDDFSGALRASIGNESVWRIDRKWNGTSSNDTCAPTWSWRRVAQRRTNRIQIAPVSIRFELLNDSSSLCGPVALDDVESTDCNAVTPTISANQLAFEVERGKPLRLVVATTGFPPASVSWVKGDGNPIGGSFALQNQGTVLYLASAAEENSGRYQANASNTAGWASLQINVIVYAKPAALRPSVDLTYIENDSFSLNCTVTGFPDLVIEWFHDVAQSLATINRTNVFISGRSVHFRSIRDGQQGRFYCTGSNSYGSARETFNIIVQVPPRILPLRRQIVTRSPVYVTCQASGRPDPVIRWIVNGTSSPSPADGFTDFNNGTIRIEPRWDATVSCTAENGIGKPATETIQILQQVDGSWSPWSPWPLCSVTCGRQTQTRSRSCSPPRHGGSNCTGMGTETRECSSNTLCPIDGGWSDWSSWSPCSRSCGTNAVRTQTRTCTFPVPANDGKRCSGLNRQEENCPDVQACPAEWGLWGEWLACPETCGLALRARRRNCVNPETNATVSRALCLALDGTYVDSGQCNLAACPNATIPLLEPKDVSVSSGGTAVFECRVLPSTSKVTWFRDVADSLESLAVLAADSERFDINPNGTLMIKDVSSADEGTYTCRANEYRGTAELKIEDESFPTYLYVIIVIIVIIAIAVIVMIVWSLTWIRRNRYPKLNINKKRVQVESHLTRARSMMNGSEASDPTLVSYTSLGNNSKSGSVADDETVSNRTQLESVADSVGENEPVASTPTIGSKSPKLDRNGSTSNSGRRRPRPLTLNLEDHRNSPQMKKITSSPRTPNRSSSSRPYDRQASAPPGAARGILTPDATRVIGGGGGGGGGPSRGNAGTTAAITSPAVAGTISPPTFKVGSLPRLSQQRQHREGGEGESDQTLTPTLPRAKSHDRGLSSPNPRNPWSGSEPGIGGGMNNDGGIPMIDMTPNRRRQPYDSPAASDFGVGQLERYRPSGSSMASSRGPVPTTREPPKRTLSYDPKLMAKTVPADFRHDRGLATAAAAATTPLAEAKSESLDDVFEDEPEFDKGYQMNHVVRRPVGASRAPRLPSAPDGRKRPPVDRRRSETEL